MQKRRRDFVGKPDAGKLLIRFDERGTGITIMEAGLMLGAKAMGKLMYPLAGAPALDTTIAFPRPTEKFGQVFGTT